MLRNAGVGRAVGDQPRGVAFQARSQKSKMSMPLLLFVLVLVVVLPTLWLFRHNRLPSVSDERSLPLMPLRAYFGTTETEQRCDESHSFTLIRRFRENNKTYCGPSREGAAPEEAETSRMQCIEAEGCVVCRGLNLVIDFSKIHPRDSRGYSAQGVHKHFNYDKGAFGMSCDFNRQIVEGRGYAHLLDNMWKTWTKYNEQDCDVIVEHPVMFVVRFEAWNLWHQLGDWFCMFVSNLALGIDPQSHNAQVIFFDGHEPSQLVEPYSLFSRHEEAKRALIDTEWSGKKVCFRDAIFPYEGYGAAFERNGYHVSTGDPCGPSDLLLSLSRWILNQYGVLQKPIANKPAITLIVRRSGTGEKKTVDRKIENEQDLVQAINSYSKEGIVNVVDLAELSFREQLELVHTKTNILIGVHGAGLSHLVFLPTEAIVIELVPGSHRDMIFFRNMAKQTNKVYLKVGMQGNRVPIDEFLKTLDAAVAISRSFGTNIAP